MIHVCVMSGIVQVSVLCTRKGKIHSQDNLVIVFSELGQYLCSTAETVVCSDTKNE